MHPSRFILLSIALVASLACRETGSQEPDLPHEHASDPSESSRLPELIDNFTLLDHNGKAWELYRQTRYEAVVLISHGVACPILRWSLPTVEELREKYGQRVLFLYYNANDTREELVDECAKFGVETPVLLDSTQWVTHGLGTQRTAEAMLIDSTDWSVHYRGRIDNKATYGAQRGGESVPHLQNALDQFLAGQEIETPSTQAEGCLIWLGEAEESLERDNTFVRDVAPILLKRCVPCHRDGGIAPFAMDSYRRVRRWSPMIREVVLTRRMPPWQADPHIGVFRDDKSLGADETRTLLSWIDGGTPLGEGQDPLAAHQSDPTDHWILGEPDILLKANLQELPATGIIPYRYDKAQLTVTEDIWVRGVDLRPQNRQVLHHALILIRYPKYLRHLEPDYLQGVGGYFALYTPNREPHFFPEGTGRWIPAGSKIIFQFHYTSTGKPETDQPTLALYLHEEVPAIEYKAGSAIRWDIQIPAGAENHTIVAETRFPKRTALVDMTPHMHYRGKSFDYVAHYPDGSTETLLSVPNYDFNWQNAYVFAEPKILPKGTRVVCTAVFDNSIHNPFNPDPTELVRWGPNSDEEMMIGYMNYYELPEQGQ